MPDFVSRIKWSDFDVSVYEAWKLRLVLVILLFIQVGGVSFRPT
jgi:hypothetical protein